MDFDHHKVFGAFLLKAEQKYTTQRKHIVDEVFKIHDHFEIEEFISILRNAKIIVARATVYSTVKLLLEAKLVRKVRLSKGDIVTAIGTMTIFYDIISPEHMIPQHR